MKAVTGYQVNEWGDDYHCDDKAGDVFLSRKMAEEELAYKQNTVKPCPDCGEKNRFSIERVTVFMED